MHWIMARIKVSHHGGEDEMEEGEEHHEVIAVDFGDVFVANHNPHHG